MSNSIGQKQSTLEVTTTTGALAGALLPYYELIKPRIALLIVISTAVGYCYGVGQHFGILVFVHTLLGTALLAAGAAALNQWYERDIDALMTRTKSRPIPAGDA